MKLGEKKAFLKDDRNNTACVTANGKINDSMQRWVRGAAAVAKQNDLGLRRACGPED